MSSRAPSTRWWRSAGSRISSRLAQTSCGLISPRSWPGHAAPILNDFGVLPWDCSLGGCNLKENTMSVYKRGKKGTHWHYYFRVRGVRYRGAIPEARTKWEAEQAESKIKREIFENRFGQVDLGSEKLAAFIETVFLPWSKSNKRSWG